MKKQFLVKVFYVLTTFLVVAGLVSCPDPGTTSGGSASISFMENQSSDLALTIDKPTYSTIVEVDGKSFLYQYMNGTNKTINSFIVGAGGSLTAVGTAIANASNGINIDSVRGFSDAVTVGDKTFVYLLDFGAADRKSQIIAFEVGADGTLTWAKNTNALTNYGENISSVDFNGTPYIFVFGANVNVSTTVRGDRLVEMFSIADDGALTLIGSLKQADDNANYKLGALEKAKPFVTGGKLFLYTASGYRAAVNNGVPEVDDNTISVFEVTIAGGAAAFKQVQKATYDSDAATKLNFLDHVAMLNFTTVGNQPVLFSISLGSPAASMGLTAFMIDNDGKITPKFTVSQTVDPYLQVSLTSNEMHFFDVGTDTYMLIGSNKVSGYTTYKVEVSGTDITLTHVESAKAKDGADADSKVESVSLTMVGSTKYATASLQSKDTINIYTIAADGKLTDPQNFVTRAGRNHLTNVTDISSISVDDSGTAKDYLLVAGDATDGINVLSVTDGMLSHASFFVEAGGAVNLGGAIKLSAMNMNVDEMTVNSHVYSVSTTENAGNLWLLDAAGTLAQTKSLTNGNLDVNFGGHVTGATDIISVTHPSYVTGGGTTIAEQSFLVIAGTTGISIATVAADGTIGAGDADAVNKDVTDAGDSDATQLMTGASSLATAMVGTKTFLFVSGKDENGITGFEVKWDGSIVTLVDAGTMADGDATDGTAMALGGISSLAAVPSGGTSYLLAAGETDNGISVFSIAADGKLTHTDTVVDGDDANIMDVTYELDGVTDIATTVYKGKALVFAAGTGDDGISVFTLSGGKLTHLASFDDDTATDAGKYKLAGVKTVWPAMFGDKMYLYAGGTEDGVSIFSIK